MKTQYTSLLSIMHTCNLYDLKFQNMSIHVFLWLSFSVSINKLTHRYKSITCPSKSTKGRAEFPLKYIHAGDFQMTRRQITACDLCFAFLCWYWQRVRRGRERKPNFPYPASSCSLTIGIEKVLRSWFHRITWGLNPAPESAQPINLYSVLMKSHELCCTLI